MTLNKYSAAAALAVATMAAPAFAQDDKPFDGFYLGAEAGYDRFKVDNEISGLIDTKDSSIYYGGIFGWREQTSSNLVYGIEGRFGDNTAKVKGTISDGMESVDLRVTNGRQIGVDAIIGTLVNENTLLFASGGYVNGKLTVKLEDNSIIGPLNLSDSDHGFRVGGGAEFRLNDQFNFRVTGHYQDVGSTSNLQVLAGVILPF